MWCTERSSGNSICHRHSSHAAPTLEQTLAPDGARLHARGRGGHVVHGAQQREQHLPQALVPRGAYIGTNPSIG